VCDELKAHLMARKQALEESAGKRMEGRQVEEFAAYAAKAILERAQAFRIPPGKKRDYGAQAIIAAYHAVVPDCTAPGALSDRTVFVHCLSREHLVLALGGDVPVPPLLAEIDDVEDAAREVFGDSTSGGGKGEDNRG
jgi:hypothetical protein